MEKDKSCTSPAAYPTHVLAAIQVLNRLECIGETLRHALNILATAAPDWLQSWVPLVWFDRYSRRFEEYRLPPAKPARYALAEQIGADGRQLLRAVDAPSAPAWLRELPAVQTLRRVWVQQFHAADADERVHWRTCLLKNCLQRENCRSGLQE
jgi:transposase